MSKNSNKTRKNNSTKKIDYDKIYFSSLEVGFRIVDGETLPFNEADWAVDRSVPGLSIVLSRNKPIPVPGGIDVVLPAIPALDIIQTHELSKNSSKLPEVLRHPLIKTPLNDPRATVIGFVSGVRSGLIKVGTTWYRLKGSGNNDKGFTIRTTSGSKGGFAGTIKPWRDIRGCAFPHTALRELLMTSQIDKLLQKAGAKSVNRSIAMMLYGPGEGQARLPLGSAFPTACIAEETFGDRRLGSHILAGIFYILPRLLVTERIDVDKFAAHFPVKRPRDEYNIPVETASFISDHVLMLTEQFNASTNYKNFKWEKNAGLVWPTVPRDATTLFSFADNLQDTNLLASIESPVDLSNPPHQLTREGPKKMSDYWLQQWQVCVKDYNNALEVAHASNESVLAYLFSRFGYDSGKIAGTLHSNGINWGTYQDAMTRKDLGEWHCNAHSNNLVVLSEKNNGSSKERPLLGALDFDMAFNMESYVDMDAEKIGTSKQHFDAVLHLEYLNLLEVLAGADSSNGIPDVALSFISESDSPAIKLIRTALYDNLVNSFLTSYNLTYLNEDKPTAIPSPWSKEMHAVSHSLIRLAIIVMAEFVA